MCKVKFFLCNHCGNLIEMIHDASVPVVCCGEKMMELVPGSVDAAQEKHVPVIVVSGTNATVKVGEIAHPMEEAHYIQWVYLQTEQGKQRKCLKPGDKPEVTFALTAGDKVLRAFEYCNLHGLWVKEA